MKSCDASMVIQGDRVMASRQGFALIVTLSLMILLTVIAVGLLSLSSISLRTSSQGEAIQVARANAKVALLIALGDLQKQLGPDTRITATADQIGTAGSATSSTPLAQRHWAGAYQSWAATDKNRPQNPTFLQWFVSGDPTKVKDKGFAASVGSSQVVEIVSKNAVGATGDPVTVPKVLQTLSTSGNSFAWWVSDEGVKAYIPTDPSPTANGTSDQRLAMQAAPNMGLKVMTDSTGTKKPLEGLDQESAAIRKLVSMRQTELVLSTTAKTDVKSLYHDVSCQNKGLLTDVRKGGFRQDLSMILQAPETSVPTTALYTSGGIGGINLAELWAYYNLPSQLKSGGSTYTSGDAMPSNASYLQQETSVSAFNSSKFHYLKQPAYIRFQQLLSFYAKPKAPITNPPNYELGIVIDPIITLWNPLDVPLSLEGSFVSIKYFALPYDIKINVNGIQNNVSIGKMVGGTNSSQGANFLTMRIGNSATKPVILKPGEVMVFSQKNTATSTPGGGAQQVEAQPGWVYNPTAGGYYYPYSEYKAPSKVAGPGTAQFSYSVTPNSDKSLGTAYASAHNIYYKFDRSDNGQETQQAGYYTIDNRINASESQYLSFFDKITPSANIPLSNVVTKRPFMVFSFLAKTEEGSENPGRFFARYNPRAIKLNFYDLEQNEQRMMPFEIKTQAVTSVFDSVGEATANGNSYFGGGWTLGSNGSTTVITHSVPRQPPVSLAAFQHSMANGFPIDANGRIITNSLSVLYPLINHAIGNSMATSLLASDKTEGAIGGPRTIVDHSYLANEALWDSYFLSGIAPQNAVTFSTKRDQKAVAQDFLNSTKSLPVKQYKPNLQGVDAATVLTKLVNGTTPVGGSEKLTASYIAVDGMFNVNSTSVEAWKALLSSLRNRDIMGTTALGADDTIKAPTGTAANASLMTPANLPVTTDSSGALQMTSPTAQWAGVHMLSDAEITSLAKAVVLEVRKRGPFLSLADFINRRVGSDKTLAVCGAIQSALDSDTVPINKAFRTGSRASKGSEAGLAFPEAERGAAAYGIPGYVKQADILTPIAPLLSARSDTFVIRGYGEKTNAAGTTVIAKACCEAVVQRGANFMDPSEEASTDITALRWPVNQTYGRRFNIISFRWLSSSEI
ncbi:MAG: hypothetical protein QE267_05355 [Akkermansiaceae bacterium]|nr:hypothetical protein [Akkermansiaceae bacterium]